MVPILFLTKSENLAHQITYIIDFSVKAFLLVYIVCSLAFLKITITEKKFFKTAIGIFALMFCILMIAESSVTAVLVALLFSISGVFVLPLVNKEL